MCANNNKNFEIKKDDHPFDDGSDLQDADNEPSSDDELPQNQEAGNVQSITIGIRDDLSLRVSMAESFMDAINRGAITAEDDEIRLVLDYIFSHESIASLLSGLEQSTAEEPQQAEVIVISDDDTEDEKEDNDEEGEGEGEGGGGSDDDGKGDEDPGGSGGSNEPAAESDDCEDRSDESSSSGNSEEMKETDSNQSEEEQMSGIEITDSSDESSEDESKLMNPLNITIVPLGEYPRLSEDLQRLVHLSEGSFRIVTSSAAMNETQASVNTTPDPVPNLKRKAEDQGGDRDRQMRRRK